MPDEEQRDGPVKVAEAFKCHNCGYAGLTEAKTIYPITINFPGGDTHSFSIKQCSECNLVNTVGVTPQILDIAYSSEYYGSGSKKFLNIIEFILKLISKLKAKTLAGHVSGASNQTLKVLDIGCGRGLLLSAYQAMGCEITGLERTKLPLAGPISPYVHIGAITDDPVASKQYDLIVIWHVLEHLEKTNYMLRQCKQLLTHNGIVAIAVPNFASLQRRLFGRHWFHLDVPRHVTHLDTRWLLSALQAEQLSIINTSHTDLIQNCYGFVQSTLNAIFPNDPNLFYDSLTSGIFNRGRIPTVLLHGIIACCVAPIALVESLASSVMNLGATVQVTARKDRA